MAEVGMGNLYDLNKMMVEQTSTALKGKKLTNTLHEVAVPYFEEKLLAGENYFMMLNNENKYYTVFHINKGDSIANIAMKINEDLKGCIYDVGTLFDIHKTEDKVALEMWIKGDDNLMYCYYLFPYSKGVIEVR